MTSRPEGRSLELYFIDGRPDGMLTAEVFNWTGHILMAPRTQLGAALARREVRHTGAYILLGELEGVPTAYIGEGDDVSFRIKSHDTNKDWWTTVVFITSAANNLHKAHVQYLEARLVEVARSVGRVTLENGNAPARPTLSEAARANMEVFLDSLFMVLPALRVDMFMENARPSTSVTSARPGGSSAAFELVSRRHGLRATARMEGGEFIVDAGSQARAEWEGVGSSETGYSRLHAELVRTGILVLKGDNRVFSESYAFRSPSAAAAVVVGRPANGQREWKIVGGGMDYHEWEASELRQASESSP